MEVLFVFFLHSKCSRIGILSAFKQHGHEILLAVSWVQNISTSKRQTDQILSSVLLKASDTFSFSLNKFIFTFFIMAMWPDNIWNLLQASFVLQTAIFFMPMAWNWWGMTEAAILVRKQGASPLIQIQCHLQFQNKVRRMLRTLLHCQTLSVCLGLLKKLPA